METQFRCKCGNSMSYINQKCDACGSLGPHNFVNRTGVSAEGGAAMPASARKESYMPSGQSFMEAEPVNMQDETPSRIRGSHDDEDKFPIGIGSRSPMLNHIENMDEHEGKKERKRREKEEEEDISDDYEDESYEGEEEEDEQESKQGGLTAIIVSVILVIALILCAVYVINNYDTITKWLASPTVPEIFRPSP